MVSGTTTAGRMSDVIGRASSAASERDEILDEDEAGDVVEALLEDGKPRVLLLAEERPQLADRRVLGDRDDVGPRRHHLAHERVAEVDDALEQLPLFALDDALLLGRVGVGLGGLVRRRRLGGLVADRRRWRRRVAARLGAGVIQRVSGPSALATGANDRQQELEDALRDRGRRCTQRQQQFARRRRTPRRSRRRTSTVRRAVDADARREQRRRRRRHERRAAAGRARTAGADRRDTSPSASGPVAALGDEPQRQPHQRAERRLDRRRDTTATHARRKTTSGIIARPARSIRPLGQPALPPQPALDAAHAPVVALVIVAEQVQQAVQRQHPPLGELRVAGLARLTPRHAPRDHDVAENA